MKKEASTLWDLRFDQSLGNGYRSASQRARVYTEGWMSAYMFCPRCGHDRLSQFENNRPVADFYCPSCQSQYELKSKSGALGKKINDGEYYRMVERITGLENPDFFVMSYSRDFLQIENLMLIPKHFFVPDVIERRKPLADTARRAGWTGCQIVLDAVPVQGRIMIVSGGKIVPKETVLQQVKDSERLVTNRIDARGWLLDVLQCVNLQANEFTLSDIYLYTDELAKKHPENRNVQAKIRQQLQVLRDRDVIEFVERGRYRKKG